MISFFRAHKRAITILLVLLGAFWLSPGSTSNSCSSCQPTFLDSPRPRCGGSHHPRKVPAHLARRRGDGCLRVCVYSFTHFGILHQWHLLTTGRFPVHADPRLRSVRIDGALSVWLVGSWLGFGLVMVLWTVCRTTCGASRRCCADISRDRT